MTFEFIGYGLLLILALWLFLRLGIAIGSRQKAKEMERYYENEKIPAIVKERIRASRSVLGGQFSEQLAPYLPNFPFDPLECRFIGSPIDFLVFHNLEGEGEVIFVEVKSGKSKRLNQRELSLRKAIEERRVRWFQYSVPESVTAL